MRRLFHRRFNGVVCVGVTHSFCSKKYLTITMTMDVRATEKTYTKLASCSSTGKMPAEMMGVMDVFVSVSTKAAKTNARQICVTIDMGSRTRQTPTNAETVIKMTSILLDACQVDAPSSIRRW